MNENREILDQIAVVFLDRWLTEFQQIRTKMGHLEDSEYRDALSKYDPSFSKVIEGLTRKDKRKTLENLALAYAVAEAIVKGHQILP